MHFQSYRLIIILQMHLHDWFLIQRRNYIDSTCHVRIVKVVRIIRIVKIVGIF